MKRSIIFIITEFGSFNNFLSPIAVNLLKDGWKVILITSASKIIKTADKYNYKQEGLVVEHVEFPRGFDIRAHIKASWKVKKLVKAYKPQIVNLHFTTAMFTTFITGPLRDTYTIGMFHGLGYPLIDGYKNRVVFEIVEKYCLANLDEVLVINNFDYALLEKRYKDKLYKLTELGLGCNLQRFDPSRYESSEIRRELGIAADTFVVTFVGRYVHFKGYHLVVRAIKKLVEDPSYQNVKLLTIGGADPLHDSGLTVAEKEWLKGSVWVSDIGFSSEVAKYLAASNLFLFPSRREGLPVCILEACAMGVPTMTFDARGCNDIVDDSVGYLLHIQSTEEEIVSRLKYILSDMDGLQRKRQLLLTQRDKYNESHFVKRFQTHLNDVFAKKSAS